MLRLWMLYLGCLLPLSSCLAQKELRIAEKHRKSLEEAVSMAKAGQTEQAVISIRELMEKYPAWTEPGQALSRIYYESGRKQEAIVQLEEVLRLDSASQLQQLYTLGRLYEETGQPEKAIACFADVIRLGGNQTSLISRAQANLNNLEEKRELWDKGGAVVFTPFDDDINSRHHESLGRWTLDGRQVIFTRLIDGQEDIFIATFDSTHRLWVIQPFPHNTSQNEGAHAISPDGKYLILTSCNRPDAIGGCDLYLSFIHEGRWTKPNNMGPDFNSREWDGQPCFGLDGKTLFFSSSRPGGYGGRDIWYVQQVAPGKWSRPINAGPAINTTDNEESPFVHFDGQSIYFMRNGDGGLGGFDLYMSKKGLDGKWQPAINLGAPINTSGHEGALTLHPDGRRAIITRETENNGYDLFQFELPEAFRSAPIQALHATVLDKSTQQPVRARLEVFEIGGPDTLRVSLEADNAGKITMALQRNTAYGVIAEAEGYIMHSAMLPPDEKASRALPIYLAPVETVADEVIILENIFFATGSYELLPTSYPELGKLVQTLEKYPEMAIEIRGHTDNTGNKKDNQVLSEMRAHAVYSYLVKRGIDISRLTYAGFGESVPIADNETPEGRQKNRRTEFRVVHQ